MKTKLVVTGLLLSVVIAVSLAQGQPPAGGGRGGQGGGRPRGMMSSMGYVEQTWAALCFDIGLSNVQIGKLKPSYQWAWKARKAAFESARKSHDYQAVAGTMATIKTTLDQHIPVVLTAEQKTAWKKWQAEQEAMRNRMRQGGGGQAPPQHK